MKEFQEIMGMKDVADFLGVTRQYIDRLARNGTLRHQKNLRRPYLSQK
jgi:DNA-directed RNA polymerase specialized sigma subunit